MVRKLFLIQLLLLAMSGIAQAQAEKVSVLWCDPLLNIRQLSTRVGILKILNNARDSGFQAVALGVKCTTGDVIYDSKLAPRLLEWKDYSVPQDFDLVGVFIEEARRRGLQVYAFYPVFSEGHMLERVGTVYGAHPEWQSSVYVVENEIPAVVPITQWAYGPVAFANPLKTEVQTYEISIISEFIQQYQVDGLILDKVRFSGLEAEFSDETRRKFETFLGGQKVDWWPADVFEWQLLNDEWQPVPGRLFVPWIEFRANAIKSFVGRLTEAVHELDPTLPVGNFVGSWYPTYYEYGANWASVNNVPEEDWASRDYNKTAFAEQLNYSVVGCFFPRITMDEAEKIGADWWMSVEGSSIVAMDVVKKATPVYGAVLVEQFKENAETFKKSLQTTMNLTDGLYVTDVSQIDRYEYWDEIAAVLNSSGSAGDSRRRF